MRELHSQAARHTKLANESKEDTTFTKREVDEQVKPSPAKSNSLAAPRRAEKYCLLRIQAAEILDVIFDHVTEKYFSLPGVTPAFEKDSKALRYGILEGRLRRVLPIFEEINFDPRLWSLLTVIKSRGNEDAHAHPILENYEMVMEDYFDAYWICREETPEYDKKDFLKVAWVARGIATQKPAKSGLVPRRHKGRAISK
ncbi:hypothetical protein TWF970_001476 [Orbilia oligospora]|uniref:Uncharacterized protein n=1 Tax=Orbilia oligospora TaxID=2813651 RepID=A0A7C8RB61_ORBOL|nr:hypothetical protein TWF970_001476 [Orbilia oligospora]